jgi:hypothetical protein
MAPKSYTDVFIYIAAVTELRRSRDDAHLRVTRSANNRSGNAPNDWCHSATGRRSPFGFGCPTY